MITFKQFNDLLISQFNGMQTNGKKLFRLNISGDQIWDAYINGFKDGENPVWRNPSSSYHNCNNDRKFIRRYGNVVAINEDYEIETLFDFDAPAPYTNTVNNIKKLLSTGKISETFVETFENLKNMPYEATNKTASKFRLGMEKTRKFYNESEAAQYGVVTAGELYVFNHFHTYLERENVSFSNKSVDTICGEDKSNFDVFYRFMREIELDTVELVRDFIKQKSILNSETYLPKIEAFIGFKREYNNATNKENFCWYVSKGLPYAKFRNEVIGTLLVDLSQGAEINEAIRAYNKKIDPANYMRANSPITPKQIADAEKAIQDGGYLESFNRRFATLSDINLSEILHKNVDSNKKTAGLFADVPTKKTRHSKAKFENVIEIGIENFMQNILPTASEIELFFDRKLSENLVALHTADAEKGIFKWSNNFGWTYGNGLTGKSEIKTEVKKAGGFVDAPYRFSIMWNEDGNSIVDLDAHAIEPNGTRIYFSSPYRKDRGNTKTSLGGQLDVDMINPKGIGVENLYWDSLSKLEDGTYSFVVHNYNNNTHNGFKAELYIDGETYSYKYDGKLTGSVVAVTATKKGDVFTVQGNIKEDNEASVTWGLETDNFHKVNLVCLSPNYWGENNVGNKHYFFMLHGCEPDVSLTTFHNEFLNGDLLPFRKQLQILSNVRKLKPTKDTLSGVGFNATVSDFVILKVGGTHKRIFKVNF